MTILGCYVCAYAIRIYIMNYYKNTRAKGQKLDNKAFFAIEQIEVPPPRTPVPVRVEQVLNPVEHGSKPVRPHRRNEWNFDGH